MAGKRPEPGERPRWPYFGPPQKRLVFAGFVIWGGLALPWLVLRPPGLSAIIRHASPLAASWILWAGLMAMAGAMARWWTLALVSAVAAGGTALYIGAWQTARILDRCEFDTSFQCFPGPGLLLILVTAGFVLLQAWRLFQSRGPTGQNTQASRPGQPN